MSENLNTNLTFTFSNAYYVTTIDMILFTNGEFRVKQTEACVKVQVQTYEKSKTLLFRRKTQPYTPNTTALDTESHKTGRYLPHRYHRLM